jgi:hypothetical protein
MGADKPRVKLPEAIGGVRAPVGIGCAINDLSAMELDDAALWGQFVMIVANSSVISSAGPLGTV